ncbi:hypothetical protein B0H13DRAFT_839039 [Mycena leptocephala]|nr:hypothetical protein B0H13DRAFT_839039 [Mycena leptocephala]
MSEVDSVLLLTAFVCFLVCVPPVVSNAVHHVSTRRMVTQLRPMKKNIVCALQSNLIYSTYFCLSYSEIVEPVVQYFNRTVECLQTCRGLHFCRSEAKAYLVPCTQRYWRRSAAVPARLPVVGAMSDVPLPLRVIPNILMVINRFEGSEIKQIIDKASAINAPLSAPSRRHARIVPSPAADADAVDGK